MKHGRDADTFPIDSVRKLPWRILGQCLGPTQGPLGLSLGSHNLTFDPKHVHLDVRFITTDLALKQHTNIQSKHIMTQ